MGAVFITPPGQQCSTGRRERASGRGFEPAGVRVEVGLGQLERMPRCSDRSQAGGGGVLDRERMQEARLEACNQTNRHWFGACDDVRVLNAIVTASESGNPIGETKREIMNVGNEMIRLK